MKVPGMAAVVGGITGGAVQMLQAGVHGVADTADTVQQSLEALRVRQGEHRGRCADAGRPGGEFGKSIGRPIPRHGQFV